MTKQLPDTWHSRDLPVLRAAVTIIDATNQMASLQQLAEATGLSEDDTRRAVLALNRGGYVEGAITPVWGDDLVDGVNDVVGEAYRLTGAWPSPEAIADRFLAALTDVAEHGTDEVTRSRARKALDGLGSLTRDTLVSVAGAAAGVAMQ
jgi:hypothetical protein